MKNNTVLVTGGNGQLGSELRDLSKNFPEFEFTFIDVQDVDLTNEKALREFLDRKHFEYIINCAAYTAVDLAEENRDLCFKVNAEAVRVIATIAAEKKSRLIHISTDYVFSGDQHEPIDEQTATSPLSVYGHSKLEGEKHVQSLLPNAYIIRTAWVYSSYGKNFVKSILNAARQRSELGVVSDQIGSPTYAGDLAKAIISIIESISTGKKDEPGVYHYSNEGVISWFDFAHFIVKEKQISSKVKPIKTSEYKTLAVRPKFSVLAKQKIRGTFGIDIPHWHDSLKTVLSKLE